MIRECLCRDVCGVGEALMACSGVDCGLGGLWEVFDCGSFAVALLFLSSFLQVEQLRQLRKLLDVVAHMNYLLKENALRLSTFPLILFQTAFNEPDSMPVTQLVASLWRRAVEIRPMFALTNKPQCRSPRVMTLTGHNGSVTCLQFSPTAGMLVSGGGDSRALIWDIGR